MGTFDIYGKLIEPVGKALQSDPRFGTLKIFYDRTAERAVPSEIMPAMNYFLESPWQDINRGSGSFSIQTRQMRVRLGFAIWCYSSKSEADLDDQLFGFSSDLLDWFREHTEFDQVNGIFLDVNTQIDFDVDYQQGDNNAFVGTQKLSVPFLMYSGSGK
jgi:hypothetical protein